MTSNIEVEKEAKLLRLRDITLYHLRKANPHVTFGDLDALDHDIKVWVKNLLLSLGELDAKAEVTWAGDNDKSKVLSNRVKEMKKFLDKKTGGN